MPNNPTGVARGNDMRGNRACYDTSGADSRSVADGHTGKNYAPATNPTLLPIVTGRAAEFQNWPFADLRSPGSVG